MSPRLIALPLALAIAAAAASCGGGGGSDVADTAPPESTTSTTEASTSTTEATTTTAMNPPLRATPVQYVGLFNAQLPLTTAGATDLRLDEIADGVFGSTVDLGTTVMVFAESPAAPITAVTVVVDLGIRDNQTPVKLVAGAAIGLSDSPADVLQQFNTVVVPELSSITSLEQRFELGDLDVILTVEAPDTLRFTFVAPGGEIPAFLE